MFSGERRPNLFIRALGEQCRKEPLAEKWVVAPSLRVGYQWLDQVARSGQPVLNARVTTLRALALNLADREMHRQGQKYLSGIAAEVMTARVLERLRPPRGGYLFRLPAGPALSAAAARSVLDLRLAGLKAAELKPEDFEEEVKGRELKALLAAYEAELKAKSYADYAEALRMATAELGRREGRLPAGAQVFLPEDMAQELAGLEKEFWLAISPSDRVSLPVDRPETMGEEELSDARLLAWLNRPAAAPMPKGDGTARIFQALGEVNEVREVLRICLAEKIPWDEVELIHSEVATYVPLLYELGRGLGPEEAEFPVTFAEGIPLRYSRPGRALMGWVAWVREGYPQSLLAQLIQDGLFKLPGLEEKEVSFSRIARLFKTVPIGQGRDRYLPKLEEAIQTAQVQRPRRLEDEAEERGERAADSDLHLRVLQAIRSLVQRMLDCSEPERMGQAQFLREVMDLVWEQARAENQLDEYSRHALRRRIQDLAECLAEEELPGLDLWQWLAELPHTVTVMGQGPRPGCLLVSGIGAGGHSGRPFTFLVGLDDSRFPGAGRQDPLLLDHERERISGQLVTASVRLERRLQELARLFSRLTGRVTLSYSCRDLTDDREMFPSPGLISAWRILSGKRAAGLEAMREALSELASFAPADPAHSLDETEWWLSRLCGEEAVANQEELLPRHFPHLARGQQAKAARQSQRFTEFDGWVPEAGKDLYEQVRQGRPLSASELELLGKCPLDYFFRYALEITPGEEKEIDLWQWLDPLNKGGLLHGIFHEFMKFLCNEGLLPQMARDLEQMRKIVAEKIQVQKLLAPPPNLWVSAREQKELEQSAQIFLHEEEAHCQNHIPRYFEVSVGGKPREFTSPIDRPDPVEFRLPNGDRIFLSGRIDRIDEKAGSGGREFSVWDYKTGKNRVNSKDPFDQGRQLQPGFYPLLAEAALRQAHPAATVVEFGYFFPGITAQGDRVRWTREELNGFKEVLQNLCELLRQGGFPASDQEYYLTSSNYSSVYFDAQALAAAIKEKMKQDSSGALAAFCRLRGVGGVSDEKQIFPNKQRHGRKGKSAAKRST